MKQRPLCAIPECPNEGWISWAGQWICGECATKLNDIQNKKMFEQMKEDLKDGS